MADHVRRAHQRLKQRLDGAGGLASYLLTESIRPVQQPDREVRAQWAPAREVAQFRPDLRNVSPEHLRDSGLRAWSLNRSQDRTSQVLTRTGELAIQRDDPMRGIAGKPVGVGDEPRTGLRITGISAREFERVRQIARGRQRL